MIRCHLVNCSLSFDTQHVSTSAQYPWRAYMLESYLNMGIRETVITLRDLNWDLSQLGYIFEITNMAESHLGAAKS